MKEQPKLGNLLQGFEGRDAVHVAILPVIAGEQILPGERICFKDESREIVRKRTNDDDWDAWHGIADPFYAGSFYPGCRFYMLLPPGSITSLRHEWVHPDIDQPGKDESEKWLRKFCKDNDCPPFEIVVAAIQGKEVDNPSPKYYLRPYSYETYDGKHCLHFNGRDAHCDIPEEFWRYMKGYLGRDIKESKVDEFTCSC